MEPPGVSIVLGDREEDIIKVKGVSQENIDMFRDVINNTTRIRDYDETLWDIISETASDFFNGRHTAQDAARIIQSRVSIYLAEQS